jgi:hypothetical protein
MVVGRTVARISAVLVCLAVTVSAAACARRSATHVTPRPPSTEAKDTVGNAAEPSDAGDASDAGGTSLLGRVAALLRRGPRAPEPLPSYTGTDPRGVPRYASRAFTDEERRLLRDVYGIEDPRRLYVSDSTEGRLLKYDTRFKRCRTCYVNSYRVGFISVRRPGESWEQVERRVRATRPRDFAASARAHTSTSTADLDPAIRADVEQMLADGRRAGFRLRVVATYRSPEREAYLMAIGGGRTLTLTSLHSYGRAIDVIVGDGKLRRAATRTQWIAFRRWLTAYKGGTFRIIGTPDRSWDWPHVEVPSAAIGFRTIEAALARARMCHGFDGRALAQASAAGVSPCDFQPRLPERLLRLPR